LELKQENSSEILFLQGNQKMLRQGVKTTLNYDR
jgi:hypothetical protein